MKQEGNKKLFADFPEISTSMWEEKINADLKGADYEKNLIWKSDEGISVKPYYRQEDIDSLGYLEGIGNLRNRSDAPNGWLLCQQVSQEKRFGKPTKESKQL